VGPDGDVSSDFVGTPFEAENAKLNEQLAESLAKNGYASLRFAKRGWDDPSEIINHDIPHLLADTEIAFLTLENKVPEVPKGVVGFSEGALLAILFSARTQIHVPMFLLSLPSRSFDAILEYQFITWPLRVLSQIDRDKDGFLNQEDFEAADLFNLPVTRERLETLSFIRNSQAHIDIDFRTHFERAFAETKKILQSPSLQSWYLSMKSLPEFSVIAKALRAPINLFVSSGDSQLDFKWILEDARFFTCELRIKVFDNLGHCFAPFKDGLSAKSSGPFSQSLIEDLLLSVKTQFGHARQSEEAPKRPLHSDFFIPSSPSKLQQIEGSQV
jgi:hypothetical protein